MIDSVNGEVFKNNNESSDIDMSLLFVFLPKCGKSKWKKEYLNSLLRFKNSELLDEVMSNMIPDDHDGYMSSSGQWRCDISKMVLDHKLTAVGWL